MEIKKEIQKKNYAIKFVAEEKGEIMGHAYLYLIYNDLHTKPYGLLEDVFVDDKYRGQGLGTKLVQAVLDETKIIGCYKLVACSRDSRLKVHEMYEKIGIKRHGLCFRMDF